MKTLRTIVKSMIVAFSVYSKIPMPQFQWESDDMKYHLCFFPLIGAVILAVEWGFYWFCMHFGLGAFFYVPIAMAIPILITGGFHLDGFMDTCDALHSYQSLEKKLEILKDPHIGAFAVICVITYFLLGAGFLAMIFDKGLDERTVLIGGLAFMLSRALSGIGVVTMKGAKKNGMLQTFSENAVKNTVLIVLTLQVILIGVLMTICLWYMGLPTFCMELLVYAYYGSMSKREFGGITGDLAGYFVSMAELMALFAMAMSTIL